MKRKLLAAEAEKDSFVTSRTQKLHRSQEVHMKTWEEHFKAILCQEETNQKYHYQYTKTGDWETSAKNVLRGRKSYNKSKKQKIRRT